jgi:hypothetical protein
MTACALDRIRVVQLDQPSARNDDEMEGDPRKVMIVHGRDGPATSGMFEFLTRIDLQPQEWGHLTAASQEGTPYIGEILDKALAIARAVVVLFTPDDEVRLHPELQHDGDPEYETEWTLQPRPNVLYEAGLAFGRKPNRTILVELGELRGLSDLLGRHTVRLDGTSAGLNELVQRLQSAGCELSTAGSRWLDPRVFPMPARVPSRAGEVSHPAGDVKPARTEPDLLSTLREILRDVVAADVDEAVAASLLAALKEQAGPFRLPSVLDRVPDRRLASRERELGRELKDHGFIADYRGPERGYVTAF